MRWQLVDRVDRYRRWSQLDGRKTLSLDECFLLEPFGRLGEFPLALVAESLVQLAGWLVTASSDFQSASLLGEVAGLEFLGPAGHGAVLALSAVVSARCAEQVRVQVRAGAAGETVCSGELTLNLCPLGELYDPAEARALWRALQRQEKQPA